MKKISGMKQKIKRYNFYFEKRSGLLIFLLLLIGVLIPAISGTPTNNFWYRLNMIMTDNFYNMLLFISIGINTIYYSKELTKNMSAVIRHNNYKGLIKNFFNRYILGYNICIYNRIFISGCRICITLF